MPYKEKYDKHNQFAMWIAQGEVQKTLRQSLKEYWSGELQKMVGNVVGKYERGGRLYGRDLIGAHTVCEKAASLLICEKNEIFLDAKKMFLRLAGIFPRKMMEEMDRIELFVNGIAPSRDYPILHSRYDCLKRDFESVDAVGEIILEMRSEVYQKKYGWPKKKDKVEVKLDPSVLEKMELLLAKAFEELEEWNGENWQNQLTFNEAFLVSVEIKDIRGGKAEYERGRGKYCSPYKAYRRRLAAQFEKNGGGSGFFEYAVRNFVKDEGLRGRMEANFDHGVGGKFEHICEQYLKRKNEPGLGKTLNGFAVACDKKEFKKLGEGSLGLEDRNWAYVPVIQRIRAEFGRLEPIEKSEYDWKWVTYATSEYIKDPSIKEKMEIEFGLCAAETVKKAKEAFSGALKPGRKKPVFGEKMWGFQKGPPLTN